MVRSGLPLWELLCYALSFSAVAMLAGVAFWAQVVAKPWRWFAEYALLVTISAVIISLFSEIGRRSHELVFLGIAALGVLVLWLVAANSGLFRRVGRWLSRG